MGARAGSVWCALVLFSCAAAESRPSSSPAVAKAARISAAKARSDLGIKSGAVHGAIEIRDTTEDPLATVVALARAGRVHCSGVLVAPSAVLTAKHCLPADRVLFGDVVEGSPTIIEVVNAVPHTKLDAAILILDSPIVAALQRRRGAEESDEPRGLVRAVGFGAIDRDARESSGRKLFVDFTVTSWGCDGDRARISHCDPRHDLAVASALGKDTCRGDSGGPIFEVFENRWRLIAITSRALSQRRSACGEGGIYTRVDVLDAWIADVITEELVK